MCPSLGPRRTASMAWVRWRWRCAGPAKATCPLGVTGSQQFWSWGKEPSVAGTAEEIAAELPPSVYRRLSAGEGTKGPRLYDWAYLELAGLEAEAEGYPGSRGTWARGPLIPRHLSEPSFGYLSTW